MSRNKLSYVPTWINHWLGYRATPPPPVSKYVIWWWSWVGAFGGVAVLQAVFGYANYFVKRGVPSIVASYGASAVLIYGAIDAPLAQPRQLIGGHFVGALTGIIITKLVHLVPTEGRYQELQWLAGSLACATSVVLMQMTHTIHPPAGATALLAAVNDEVRDMGWYLLPVVLLSSTLALAVALIVNNIQRRYPIFWIHPLRPPPHAPEPAPAPSPDPEGPAQPPQVLSPSDNNSFATAPTMSGDVSQSEKSSTIVLLPHASQV